MGMDKAINANDASQTVSECEWPYRVESECCSAEWDEDTGICLKCKEHADGVLIKD